MLRFFRSRPFRYSHPFYLLLFLEWTLLGIALVSLFSPAFLPPGHWLELPPPALPDFPVPPYSPPYSPPPPLSSLGNIPLKPPFLLGALISILGLGGLGFRLPKRSLISKIIYIGGGLALSWLALLWGGHGPKIFAPMLLIVVIRACLMFPWRGRIFVAVLAYISFLVMLGLSFWEIRPLGIPIDHPVPRHIPIEYIRDILFSAMVNAALMFGLVLGFVLLLVGSVVAEHRSRQELSMANQKLRQYALAIENQATLQERNRIAREIHDSVGHSLVAQSIQLENVAVLMPPDAGKMGEYLESARQLGREALGHVRQSVSTLGGDPLGGKPLNHALDSLITEFMHHHQIHVNSQFNMMGYLPRETATMLYRIVQEALTNIAKHSQAQQVEIQITEDTASIQLLITDNGVGFDPQQNTTGFGLDSMCQRTKALAGKFHLSSQPQQGCQIYITVPHQFYLDLDIDHSNEKYSFDSAQLTYTED